MLSTFLRILKIDSYYSMNSYIYNMRKLPVMDDLLPADAYKYQSIKIMGFVFGLLKFIFTALVLKIIYFSVIFFVAGILAGKASNNFVYIFVIICLLGMFINDNTILATSTEKYFSIVLFKIDALEYTKISLISTMILSFIFNFLALLVFNGQLHLSISMILTLVMFDISLIFIGEVINLVYYKKFKVPWYSNLKLYFTVLFSFLAIASLCNFGASIDFKTLNIITIFTSILAVISYIYLINVKDYKRIYKELNTYERIMNKSNNESQSRARLVAVKNKDREIEEKKIKNKHGYDLFNTIFFERHKNILYRSLRTYSIVLCVIFIVLIYLVYNMEGVSEKITNILSMRMGLIAFIMYFVNRGAIMTQAMFYNCDHAMLKYNFYRESEVILGLFKRRLISLTKANLLPAFIISIGVCILLYITGTKSILLMTYYTIYIMVSSIFFSIHYLVLYYLLQPYNKDMRITNYHYSLIVGLTYVIIYFLFQLEINGMLLSAIVIIFTIIYTLLSLFLVKKFAPKTFKIK